MNYVHYVRKFSRLSIKKNVKFINRREISENIIIIAYEKLIMVTCSIRYGLKLSTIFIMKSGPSEWTRNNIHLQWQCLMRQNIAYGAIH